MKSQISKQLLHAVGLITVGGALFIVAPANRAVIVPVPSPAASPTPARTPNSEPKKPNPLKRFFSQVGRVFTRPFRSRVPTISDPPIVVLRSSSSLITLCPPAQWSPSESCSPSREVTLTADVPGDQDEFLFTWLVTAGRLRGNGQKVMWDLNGLAVGTYKASVEVNAGNQLTANDSTTVKVVDCADCIWRESPCPTVIVSCPSGIEAKQPTTFQTTLAGGDPTITPTYLWTVSAGKIISGQGTPKIVVDVSEHAGKWVTATVKLGGFDPRCTEISVASCSTEVAR